jgi:uncharacterized membrane protein YkoI
MKLKTITAVAGATALAATGAAVAFGSASDQQAGATSPGSRLDDGASLQSQARISEQDAIAAAQKAASGPLNEVDLEHYNGRLVYNVDVGSRDVKVDASNGQVLDSGSGD